MVRRRSRGAQRGAAVFIVVMVITLLTAIGVFAIRSATLVDQAAGFERQGLQTSYLTEYAGRAVTAELGNGAAKSYLDRIVGGTDACTTNELVTQLDPSKNIPCYKLYISEVATRAQAPMLEAQTATASGSLGGPTQAAGDSAGLDGVFVVEMTEPYESVPNPGSEQAANASSAFRDVQVTLTAFGQIRPFDTAGASDPWCSSSSSSTSASVSALRAHITLRNVPR
jgi:Tfp pilus assembly protein PilX